MANWTDNKPAHIDTWFTLFRLGQIKKPFSTSGKIKIADLTYFNPSVSNDYLKIEATLIADTIDRVFTSWGAELENNKTRNDAIMDMIAILLNKNKTVLDLAEKNDENYFFINEKK